MRLIRSALAVLVLASAACSPAGEDAPKPVRSTGKAAVGGPFRLVDQTGAVRDESLLKGRWTAMFFGFTYCPDVCPTTLQTLAEVKEQLGPQGKDLQIVLVSVDPERDTPEALKAYLANDAFPDGVVGLTGAPAQVAQALKAYRVYAKKTGEGPDYLVDHSTAIYLIDPKGEFDRPIISTRAPEEIAADIRKAMRDA